MQGIGGKERGVLKRAGGIINHVERSLEFKLEPRQTPEKAGRQTQGSLFRLCLQNKDTTGMKATGLEDKLLTNQWTWSRFEGVKGGCTRNAIIKMSYATRIENSLLSECFQKRFLT